MRSPEKPKVSVVIPSFNRAEALRRCLDSLVMQTYKNFEVLICDDGSTDDTKEIAKAFEKKLSLRYFWNENFGGPARPRNIGIANALGCYIAFLDSDDWWEPKKLHKSVEALDTGADLVYHDLYVFYENKIKKGKPKKIKTRELFCPVFDDLLLNGNAIANSSVVVRKMVLEQAGKISEDRDLIAAEDYDAWLRISKITNRFKRLSGCYGWYTLGDSNISHPERSEKYIWRIIEIYFPDNAKNYPVWVNYALARVYLKLHKFKESKQYARKAITQTSSLKLLTKSVITYFSALLQQSRRSK